MFAHRDKESGDIDYDGVPDNVRELAKAYERKNEAMRTSADIRHINDNLRKLNKASDEVILALSYLVYDANGFRRTEPAHPGILISTIPGYRKSQSSWSVYRTSYVMSAVTSRGRERICMVRKDRFNEYRFGKEIQESKGSV